MSPANINFLNAFLMIAAAVASFYLPFEVLVLSYAILGPAHYLTQISWLHDRGYFLPSRVAAALLAALAISISFPVALMLAGAAPADSAPASYNTKPAYEWTSALLLGGFLASAVLILPIASHLRWIAAAAAVAGSLAIGLDYRIAYVGIFLPTIIHVFVFTGAFILFGALRSRSASGYFSFIVFLGCAAALLFIRNQLPAYKPAAAFQQNAKFMETVHAGVRWIFDLGEGRTSSLAAMRFLAWIYLYHYLNWFSKTQIIGWHAIPMRRVIVIIIAWIASVGLYAYDYTVGLSFLIFLATLHVVLEFPLDARTLGALVTGRKV
ncbi:MAG: hypothetical protein ACKVS6_09995 [Planctomycetota bacterium]